VGFWGMLKATWSEFSNDDCPLMAAALAYYTAFSLPSILLIVLYVAGSVFGRAAVQGEIHNSIASMVGPGIATMVQGMVRSAAESTTGGLVATALGVLGLLFSATSTLSALQTAMNRAWEVKPDESSIKSMAWKRFLSFLLIVGAGILVLISLGATTAATGLAGAAGIAFPGWSMYVLEIAVSWFVFVLIFAVLFKVLPDARLRFRDMKTGAMVTATLFIAGKFAIGFYLSHSTGSNAFGAAGALALLLLWTYYSALIFLFGVEFTQVWARDHGRSIEPEPGAVKVIQEEKPPKAA
jgi:membrane protein